MAHVGLDHPGQSAGPKLADRQVQSDGSEAVLSEQVKLVSGSAAHVRDEASRGKLRGQRSDVFENFRVRGRVDTGVFRGDRVVCLLSFQHRLGHASEVSRPRERRAARKTNQNQ
jgi:hypothetical protein